MSLHSDTHINQVPHNNYSGQKCDKGWLFVHGNAERTQGCSKSLAGPGPAEKDRRGGTTHQELGRGAATWFKTQRWGFVVITDRAVGWRREQEGYFPKSQGQTLLCVLLAPSPASVHSSKGASTGCPGAVWS